MAENKNSYFLFIHVFVTVRCGSGGGGVVFIYVRPPVIRARRTSDRRGRAPGIARATPPRVSRAPVSYVLAPNFDSTESSFFQCVSPRIKLHIFKIIQRKTPFLSGRQLIRSTAQRMLRATLTPPHPPTLCRRVSAAWS